MPPAFRNQRAPTGADTPAPIAASSLDAPAAINTQKRRRCVRCATGGRPGERSLLRNARSDRRRPAITTALPKVLRQPIEFTQYSSEQFQKLLADHGVTCSRSRSGNVWDNAAMESFFSSLKTERIAHKVYRTRDQARADVFDYIERFYNPRRRHSTIGYLSPREFERHAASA